MTVSGPLDVRQLETHATAIPATVKKGPTAQLLHGAVVCVARLSFLPNDSFWRRVRLRHNDRVTRHCDREDPTHVCS
jgi:hypothetical protein